MKDLLCKMRLKCCEFFNEASLHKNSFVELDVDKSMKGSDEYEFLTNGLGKIFNNGLCRFIAFNKNVYLGYLIGKKTKDKSQKIAIDIKDNIWIQGT